MGGASWSMVPAVLLRSTGFAVGAVEALADPVLGQRCDALLTAREDVDALRAEFDEMVFSKVLEREQAANADAAVFRRWYRVRRRVHRRLPAVAPAEITGRWAVADAWLDNWDRALELAAVAERAYLAAHEVAVRESLLRLRVSAAAERFGEAVYLSSPSMHSGLRRYLAAPPAPDRIRHLDRKVYGYLQRLTTKNETTSFFGPIDHGVVDAGVTRLELDPDAQPVLRHTRMAHWAVRAVADLLSIPLPTAEPDPLRWLRGQVNGEWAHKLDEWLAVAAEFPEAAVARKAELLSWLEEDFQAVTGGPARRADGAMYGDRLLLHDDARGSISCRIAPALVHELGEALRDALDLCAGYSVLVQEACREAAARLVTEPVPYLRFIAEVQRRVDLADCLTAPSVARFTARLATLVSGPAEVHLSRDDIAELLVDVPAGTMASPDVFLAAPDVASIAAGNYDVVVGEIHHGAQIWSHLTAFWPDLPGLERDIARLLPEGLAHLVHGRRQGKAFPFELPGRAVEMGGRSAKPREFVLSAADLEVLPGLELRSVRTGEPVVLHPGDPRAVANWLFGTPPVVVPPLPGQRTPRVSVGGAVLWRATWRLSAQEFPRGSGPAEIIAARAVWRRHGLPRRCYARVPSERKPFFVDRDSPLSMAYFLAVVAAETEVRLSEMLPDPDSWWLSGELGPRSCEWRSTWVAGAR